MPSSSPPPSEPPFTRFVSLVKRELGADDVRLLGAASVPSGASNVLFASIGDGRHVAVTFTDVPENPAALLRRLEILVRTFPQALEIPNGAEAPRRHARPPIAMSLHDELRALAQRARAVDAVVLDAHSPVVWGSSAFRSPRRHTAADDVRPALERLEESRRELLRVIRELDVEPPPIVENPSGEAQFPTPAPSSDVLVDHDEEEAVSELSERAIREVRELPAIPALRRGRPIVHVVREEDFGYVARSFAGIYLVVLVFDAPYDELRAERALTEAMPKIEQLVLALPPLDPGPAPSANVIAFRRRRR